MTVWRRWSPCSTRCVPALTVVVIAMSIADPLAIPEADATFMVVRTQ